MLCLDYCVFMETVNKLLCHSRLFKLCLKIYGLRVLASVCVRSFFLSTRLCKCFFYCYAYIKPVVFNNTSKMFLHLQVSICPKYCRLRACIVDMAVVV